MQRDWTHADSHKKLPAAKHIFSHIEWQMIGYDIRVDEIGKNKQQEISFHSPRRNSKRVSYPVSVRKVYEIDIILIGDGVFSKKPSPIKIMHHTHTIRVMLLLRRCIDILGTFCCYGRRLQQIPGRILSLLPDSRWLLSGLF